MHRFHQIGDRSFRERLFESTLCRGEFVIESGVDAAAYGAVRVGIFVKMKHTVFFHTIDRAVYIQ